MAASDLHLCIPKSLQKQGLLSVLMVCACIAATIQPASLCAQPKLLDVEVSGGHYVGMPIHWSSQDAVVLEPSGFLRVLEQVDVVHHAILPVDFLPQSLTEARNQLQSELGSRYETLVSGPYVIAAPMGTTKHWRERFNALLAGYVRYFQVRGWPLRKPDFPLCVTVFATRQEFVAYAASQGQQVQASVVGSYFTRSNRCALYTIENASGTDWAETEATIVHEAVHQLAYNTGIHERLSMDPMWFVEGLASMFEQPNVYDLRQPSITIQTRMLADKQTRLQGLLANPQQLEQQLQGLIFSDRLFKHDPLLAYDLSWAVTFYLAERMPAEFRTYSSLLSQRPFGDYSAAERTRDFRTAFGGEISMLAIQMQRLFKQGSGD